MALIQNSCQNLALVGLCFGGPNVKFLHRNSVSLDILPTFRKKIICKKQKKKSPVGQMAHWGFFLTPHHKPLLRASFCANKKIPGFLRKNIALGRKIPGETNFKDSMYSVILWCINRRPMS